MHAIQQNKLDGVFTPWKFFQANMIIFVCKTKSYPSDAQENEEF